MPPVVAQAVVACLATAPGFSGFGEQVKSRGFDFVDRQNGDSRFRHPGGHEAFLSDLPARRVCSVWFNGDYASETSKVARLARGRKEKILASASDNLGNYWQLDRGRLLRLVVKQGDPNRLGVALSVEKNTQ